MPLLVISLELWPGSTCCPVVRSISFCCQDLLFPLSPLNSLLIWLCFIYCSSLEVNSIGSFSVLPLVSPSEYLSFFLLLAWFALCYIIYSFFYFRVYITWFWLDHLLALIVTDVVMWLLVALYELCSHCWDYPMTTYTLSSQKDFVFSVSPLSNRFLIIVDQLFSILLLIPFCCHTLLCLYASC